MGEEESRAPTEGIPLEKVDDYSWRIPQYKPGMRVPGMIFADKDLLGKMQTDRTDRKSTRLNSSHTT
jgi:hypothetical protein